jgi:hypothetical protein
VCLVAGQKAIQLLGGTLCAGRLMDRRPRKKFKIFAKVRQEIAAQREILAQALAFPYAVRS